MELQEKLARFRKEKGLSQMELAEELGVSRQAVSKWETGTAVPSSDRLIRLSELYGVPLDELVFDAQGKQAGAPQEIPPAPAAEELVEISPPPAEEGPGECSDEEEIVTPQAPRKNIAGPVVLIAFICICTSLLLWGWLTNSMVIAKSLVVLAAILFALRWLLCCLHTIATCLRKDDNTK